MQSDKARENSFVAAIGAFLGWFSLLAQLWLILLNRTMSITSTLVQYFSFFTILSNILMCLCYSAVAFKNTPAWFSLFSKPRVKSAALLYIIVVGLVYNVILRNLWEPKGLQLVVDEMLHTLNPLLYLNFWWFFVEKKTVRWKDAFSWLVFPLVYLLYILTRGAISGLYPYPFINVAELGYLTVFLNSFLLLGIFLFFSVIIIWVAKMRSSVVVN